MLSYSFVSNTDSATQHHFLVAFYTFHVNGYSHTFGYIHRKIIGKIQWSEWWSIDHNAKTVTLATLPKATSDVRSRVLDDTLQSTRNLHLIPMLDGWRDEKFPLFGPQGEVLFEIERCASPLFGIVSYGVQLLAYVTSEEGIKLWIGKRSDMKQTYPGMLDCTAAGGLGTGKLPIESVICEAQEEASITEKLIRTRAKPMPHLSYFHVSCTEAGGERDLFQPEIEYTYELELDSATIPEPNDSEVDYFSLYTIDEVLSALKQGRFKPNSGIVVVEFLIQHGILTSENLPNYLEILSHLHRELPFPVLIQPSV
jgi:isopentenyldiphosphate isomerase